MPRHLRAAPVCLVLLAVGCAPIVRAAGNARERQIERYGLRQGSVLVDGACVEYWAGGQGEPVVLLHGFGPPAPWQWTEQVDALEEDYRVLMPNLLWFGDSVDPKRDFGLERQVEVMAGLMQRLGFTDSTVIGVSYGGFVAHRLAALRPDLVRRLVLVDSPGTSFEREDYQALLDRHDTQTVNELFIPSDDEGVERLLELAYWDPPSVPAPLEAATAEVIYDRHRQEKNALLDGLVASIGAYERTPLPQQPTLLIWGRHDTIFPVELAQEQAQTLGATLVVIDEARHAPNIEHPDLFNRILLDWLHTAAVNEGHARPDSKPP